MVINNPSICIHLKPNLRNSCIHAYEAFFYNILLSIIHLYTYHKIQKPKQYCCCFNSFSGFPILELVTIFLNPSQKVISTLLALVRVIPILQFPHLSQIPQSVWRQFWGLYELLLRIRRQDTCILLFVQIVHPKYLLDHITSQNLYNKYFHHISTSTFFPPK